MRPPWEPKRWLFDPGSWTEVETAIGTHLPSDYKELIGEGFAWVFDEELWIASPFDPNPNLNLVFEAARWSRSLAALRAADGNFSVKAYPERGGLLAWGVDGGGGIYFWDTTEPDPDSWSVAVHGRPTQPTVHRYTETLTTYLDGLANGRIAAVTLSDWPGPSSTVERRPS